MGSIKIALRTPRRGAAGATMLGLRIGILAKDPHRRPYRIQVEPSAEQTVKHWR